MRSDFNSRFDAARRSHERFKWFVIAVQVSTVIAIVWFVFHPEAVGDFFGRVASGFIGGINEQ